MRITIKQVDEIDRNHFVTEASAIGLAPGMKWPLHINTDIGNRQPLRS